MGCYKVVLFNLYLRGLDDWSSAGLWVLGWILGFIFVCGLLMFGCGVCWLRKYRLWVFVG